MAQNCGKLCYCQGQLRKLQQNIGEWTCGCCFRAQTVDTFYYCTAANCMQKKVTGSSYFACSACVESADHEEEEMDSKSQESLDAKAFLLKKVRWMLDRISSVEHEQRQCPHTATHDHDV